MKVLLVDDHPLILAALKAMIQRLTPAVDVDAVSSGAEVRQSLRRDAERDLMLLDLQLEDCNGFELLAEIRKSYPMLPVVVVSASDRSADVIRAIDLGAMGFVPKRTSTDMLMEALRVVMAGGIYVPTMSLDGGESADPVAAPARDSGFQTQASFEDLGITPRQTDVLMLLLQGKPNKDIARRLGLSVETVKDHVQAVLRALGVNTRTQAVLAVSQMRQRPSGGGGLPRY